MPTFLLHGALHGGPGGLRQTPGQVSRVQGRASNPVQRDPGFPHQLHATEIP